MAPPPNSYTTSWDSTANWLMRSDYWMRASFRRTSSTTSGLRCCRGGVDRALWGQEPNRQFLLRGLEKVNGEWSLICTGHNPESSSGQALLKLFRFGINQPRETRINSIVRCIRNIAEVVSPVMRAKLLIRHRLQPPTIVAAT